jgi:hypothetical protein
MVLRKIYFKKKEQWIKATNEEEDRIRQMKKSRDCLRWTGLSNEINEKFWELANLWSWNACLKIN